MQMPIGRKYIVRFVLWTAICLAPSILAAVEEARLEELNAYWTEVSRAVRDGDFEAYKATCDDEGVLVSISRRSSVPLSQALARWKPGIDDTKAGKQRSSVAFKFGQRLGDDTTAHETGIFHYVSVDSKGERQDDYLHFEGLLLKKDGWKMVMEYQKTAATLAEWDALPGPVIEAATEYRIRKIATSVNRSFRGMSVVDDQVAWVSGTEGTIGQSVDGGVTWAFHQVPGKEAEDFRSIYAFDRDTAVVANAGSPGYILLTENAGRSWRTVYSNSNPSVFIDGIDFWDERKGLIYGDPIDGRMLLLRTEDGGLSWGDVTEAPLLSQGEASFAASSTGIRCLDPNDVLIVTGGVVSRLWKSSNAGDAWNALFPPILQGQPTTGIYSLAVQDSRWILVGGDYTRRDLATAHHLVSSDSGTTWHRPQPAARGYRECVEFIDSQTVVSTGPTGTDLSRDGGLSWNSLSDEENFHVVRRARQGSLILMAGGQGQIAILE